MKFGTEMTVSEPTTGHVYSRNIHDNSSSGYVNYLYIYLYCNLLPEYNYDKLDI